VTVADTAINASHAISGIPGYVGLIPVRNLWLLMLYASDLMRQSGVARRALEELPDDIPDLVAEILARLVKRRLKRNLSCGYRIRDAHLTRVRGHINILETECGQLLDRGRIACRFEELTVDTPRNRFVRAALDEVGNIVNRREIARRCRSLAASLRRMGVVGEKPSLAELSVDRFGRCDVEDRHMVSVAHLVFNLALPTEAAGRNYLSVPDRQIAWIRKLYEKAVAGFYDVVLPKPDWRVDAGKVIAWPVERKTTGIDKILPAMRTDIVLTQISTGRRIVIDTKFNSIVTAGWYREESLRSGYMYQIYAYVRSQEDPADPLSLNTEGLLLHPSVGNDIDETAVIQGHEIRFATVDLGSEAKEIRKQLLSVVGVIENR
jgi:5-methylcytosine-specific restriction enzyme subunit McrC